MGEDLEQRQAQTWGFWRRLFHVHKWSSWDGVEWQSAYKVIGKQFRYCLRCGLGERRYVD
jgi:hypothetical protein